MPKSPCIWWSLFKTSLQGKWNAQNSGIKQSHLPEGQHFHDLEELPGFWGLKETLSAALPKDQHFHGQPAAPLKALSIEWHSARVHLLITIRLSQDWATGCISCADLVRSHHPLHAHTPTKMWQHIIRPIHFYGLGVLLPLLLDVPLTILSNASNQTRFHTQFHIYWLAYSMALIVRQSSHRWFASAHL